MSRPAADSVKVESTTTGTGTMTLGSAVSGFQAFPAALDGAIISYSIEHQSNAERENGLGTYTHSGTTLSRDYVSFSTNGNSLVDFSSGTKHVRITALVLDFVEHRDTVDPTSSDNIDSGHIAGRSRWLNTATERMFLCINDGSGTSPTAATWIEIPYEQLFVNDSGNYATSASPSAPSFKVGSDGRSKGELRRFTANDDHDLEFIAANLTDGDYGWLERAGTGTVTLVYNDINLNGGTSNIPLGTRVKWEVVGGAVVITGGTKEDIDLDATVVQGNLAKVETKTGALANADSGKIIVTSGNITIPTTAGFNVTLISGGAHTVTFNATTSPAMAAGDLMSIVVEDATTIHAVLTASADKVSFT